MNTKGTEYGGISTHSGGFQAMVTNPITKQFKYLGFYKTINEAQKSINDWNFDFFSEHSWALPRCIALNRRDKQFLFCVQVKGKTIIISSSKSLDVAVEEKLKFINQMI